MAFTRGLGGKSLADNIRVVGINPGPVATDRLVSLYKQMAQTKPSPSRAPRPPLPPA